MRCSRGMACGRPTSSPIPWRATRGRRRCCARLLEGGDCEIGAHHHAWETPPFSAEDVRRHPYASTLPRAQFEAQLEALTSAITRAVGRRPVSYRSGRFGFSADHVAALEARADTSSSRASLRCSTRRTKVDRNSSTLRFVLISSPTTAPCTPGQQQRPRSPGFGGAESSIAAAVQRPYARAPTSVHDQARAAGARDCEDAMAADRRIPRSTTCRALARDLVRAAKCRS